MSFLIRPTSLFFKVIVVTSLILILTIAFHLWWNLTLFEASIETMTQEKTKIVSEFIEKNVIRAMQRGRHQDIQGILRNFAVYRGITKIALFTPDGTIRSSTRVDELNKRVGNVDFYLKNKSFLQKETDQEEKGETEKIRVYYFNSPILNQPECFQCHNPQEKVLGILTVGNSLKENDEIVLKVQLHSIILALVTVGFLSFVLIFLFFRFIEHPIKKMTGVMGEVEGGNFNARVDVKSRDEMGKLGSSLNTMIEKLKLAKEEAEAYHRELVQRADRMATVGELASGIAHEIRNPLAGIHGAVQIIADGLPKEDSRRQILEEVQKQIHRLERLVKDLLNYVKPAPANYLPTDINGLVDKVLSFFLTQRGKQENLRVEKSFSSAMPGVLLDSNSMEQAFLNIILNAQKAMPKGGTLTVSTRLLDSQDGGKDKVQVVFEDTGEGIRKENLRKIFDPFYSTRSDGTGLGLSITKNIVEQHRGKIEVESQVNVGTKVIITIPITIKD
jgi:signal transduction histidine kinase